MYNDFINRFKCSNTNLCRTYSQVYIILENSSISKLSKENILSVEERLTLNFVTFAPTLVTTPAQSPPGV